MQRSIAGDMQPCSSPSGPFGLGLSLAVFDRAARLAHALIPSAGASIILVHEGEIWRSRYAELLPAHDPFAEKVLKGGALCWIEDGTQDADFRDHPLVTGPPFLRFTVAVPVRLADGSTPGVLSLSGPKPQPFDAAIAMRLRDIADFVADDWSRAHAIKASADALAERDQALDRSARSEARLQLALTLSDLHVWELDYRRRELIKAGAEDMFFCEPQTFESLNRNMTATIDPRDRPAVAAAWQEYVENGTLCRPEYRVVRLDGAEFWVRSSVTMLHDEDGRPVRMVGAVQNITPHKLAERALRAAKDEADAANRAKSAFLAAMSHELRTPLNAILGFSEMIREQIIGPVPRRYVDYARDIHASGTHLLELVNDVLDLSKLEAGKFELHEADFDPADLLAEVASMFVAQAGTAGIALRMEVPGLPLLHADRRLIKQVMLNAISNALKFTPRGGTVTVGAAHRPGGDALLEIRDTGIGMSEVETAVALMPFGQIDSHIARMSRGTGLGVPIACMLMKLHGGAFLIASEPGHGTCVTLRLPASRVRKPAAVAAR